MWCLQVHKDRCSALSPYGYAHMQRVGIGRRGCMQAEHELSNAEQLLAFLRRAPDGTYADALKDAYPAAMADIARLHKEHKVCRS